MRIQTVVAHSALALALVAVGPARAFAYCDGLDGPVVKAPQAALDAGDAARVLIWVSVEDEPGIRGAFERTLAVRDLGPDAKALADRFFFETVVRVHRAGEGASYTGLKPAGRDLGPAIPAADRALDEGSPDRVMKLLTGKMEQVLRAHFEEAAHARGFEAGDVGAGRRYVRAYVEFIHYVERLYETISTPAHGHFAEGAAPGRR
jgi:hypothetical protein